MGKINFKSTVAFVLPLCILALPLIGVQLINLAEGLKVPEDAEPITVDVTISGPEAVIAQLRERNITAVIDARQLLAGTHQLKVAVSLDEAYRDQIAADKVLCSPMQVTLVLEEENMDDPAQ